MPILHAVLSLLVEGPSHGYGLKSDFERAIGPQWGALNIGHLHQVIDRLERDGLIVGKVVAQTGRPDKTVYRITPAGRAELESWLAAPFVRQSGYRDDFFLKLFAASRLGPARVRAVIETQREAYLRELAALGELGDQHAEDALVSLLIQAAILHTETNLKLTEVAQLQFPLLAENDPTSEPDTQGSERSSTGRTHPSQSRTG